MSSGGQQLRKCRGRQRGAAGRRSCRPPSKRSPPPSTLQPGAGREPVDQQQRRRGPSRRVQVVLRQWRQRLRADVVTGDPRCGRPRRAGREPRDRWCRRAHLRPGRRRSREHGQAGNAVNAAAAAEDASWQAEGGAPGPIPPASAPAQAPRARCFVPRHRWRRRPDRRQRLVLPGRRCPRVVVRSGRRRGPARLT